VISLRTSLETLADLASILTAVVAVLATVYYKWSIRHKCRKLEKFLKLEKERDPNPVTQGQHNTVYLMAVLGFTGDEVLQASFRSKNILRIPVQNPEFKRAVDILYRHK
jgi:hypothetical protein